jgi:ABC-type transport system substrate-binding protein
MLRTRIGALVAVSAIAFAACGGTASPSPSAPAPAGASTAPSTSPSAQPAGSPQAGGTLVVGIPGDMVTADPTLVSDSNSSYIMINVIEGLLGIKAGTLSDIEPILARPAHGQRRRPDPHVQPASIKPHDGTDSTRTPSL